MQPGQLFERCLRDVAVPGGRLSRPGVSAVDVALLARRHSAAAYHCCLSARVPGRSGTSAGPSAHRHCVHLLGSGRQFDQRFGGALQPRSGSVGGAGWDRVLDVGAVAVDPLESVEVAALGHGEDADCDGHVLWPGEFTVAAELCWPNGGHSVGHAVDLGFGAVC